MWDLPDDEGETSFYSTGALIVDSVFQASGVVGVRRLLSAGRSDAELYGVLRELIGLTRENFDAWWRSEAPRAVSRQARAPGWTRSD